MSVLFTHCCKYNRIWCDCHTSERFSAIKPGSIMTVVVHSLDVFCHLILPLIRDFPIEFSSEFSIFVILLLSLKYFSFAIVPWLHHTVCIGPNSHFCAVCINASISSQEYDSCYQFVWCVWAFDFAFQPLSVLSNVLTCWFDLLTQFVMHFFISLFTYFVLCLV